MSISLKNHEDRIKFLERVIDSPGCKKIMSTITNMNPSSPAKSLDFTQWNDWDFIYFRYDAWSNKDVTLTNDGLIPVVMLKEMWCREILMYNPEWMSHEGFQFYIDSNKKLNYKFAGNESGGGSLWFIYALKIYYIFRYNIQQILELISPILKF